MRDFLAVAVLVTIATAGRGYEHRRSSNPVVTSAMSGTETLNDTRRLNRQRRSTCGGVIEDSSGVIASPNFPDSYPPTINCTWEIMAPPSFRVVLNFTNFELEEQAQCSYDRVSIYTEDKDGRIHLYGSFCGSTLPPEITSETNKLQLEFSTDSSNQFAGFNAVFHTEPIYDMGIIELNSSTYPNGSVLLSWTWLEGSAPHTDLLAGYYLRGTSLHHSFQKTLPSLQANYTANCLHGYTVYEISLEPFFKLKDSPPSQEWLGKVATVKVKTPASAPGPPAEVVAKPLLSHNRSGRLELHIAGPVAWNCQPSGFRVRWEPAQGEETSWQELKIPDGSAHLQQWTFRLNATQSLKPGRDYTLFVSAQGYGDFGDILIGPETSQTVAITPQDPVNVTAKPLDSTRAAIIWTAPSPAQYFLVTVDTTIYEDTAMTLAGPGAQPSGCGIQENPIATFYLEGCSQEWSHYSVPMLGLRPLCKYWASVQACSRSMCSEVVVVEFEASQEPLRAPSFTTVEAVAADSVQLQWEISLLNYAEIPQFEVRLHDGDTFRSHSTVNTTLRVANLTAETTYAVELRAFFERVDGARQMGPPARTSVTTWSLVPGKPIVDVKYDDGYDAAIMSWTFLNSTVDTLQVDNGADDWKDCSAVADCTYVVQRGWNSSFKAGFLEMRSLHRSPNYTLLIRGCNSHGCGASAAAHVKAGTPDAGEVAELNFTQTENSSGLLTWSACLDPPTGYIASWQCDNGELFGRTTASNKVEVIGLPPDRGECTFSVAAFNQLRGGQEVRGRASAISVPFADIVI